MKQGAASLFSLVLLGFSFSASLEARPGAEFAATNLGGCTCHGGVSAGNPLSVSFQNDRVEADRVYAIQVSFPSTPRNGGENTFLLEVRDESFQRVGDLVLGFNNTTPREDVTSDDTYIRRAQIVEVLPTNVTSRTYFWKAPNNSTMPEEITVYGQVFDSSGSGTGGDRHYFATVSAAGTNPFGDNPPPFAGTDPDDLGNRDDASSADSSDNAQNTEDSTFTTENEASQSDGGYAGGCSLTAGGGQRNLDLVIVFVLALFGFLSLLGFALRQVERKSSDEIASTDAFKVATNA